MTPFDSQGKVDVGAMARLLAWFEAAGCKGAVLAGTNGEGPSLSAMEKRDLIRDAMAARGKLELILGVATSSLEEAVWSCNQAFRSGAVAALVMAPSYFREASDEGIVAWFRALMDRTEMPILVYNFPQRTGISIRADMLEDLADHERFAGVKDSSGYEENLMAYAGLLGGSSKALFVGNETLLLKALRLGWTGTISGAANVMPYPLACIVDDWISGRTESAEAKFAIAVQAIEALRGSAQPTTNKALLEDIGVLPSRAVRLPLLEGDAKLRGRLEAALGPLDGQGG